MHFLCFMYFYETEVTCFFKYSSIIIIIIIIITR